MQNVSEIFFQLNFAIFGFADINLWKFPKASFSIFKEVDRIKLVISWNGGHGTTSQRKISFKKNVVTG